MVSTTLSPFEPVSSGEIQAIDLEPLDEAGRKHARLAVLLERFDLDGLLLRDPANFAWLSCGGDNTRCGSSPCVASILVTRDARVVLCSKTDSGQLFDRELMGLGFQLKERPWTEDADVLINDVVRGRRIGSDVPYRDTTCLSDEIRAIREALTAEEVAELKEVGKLVAHAVEATARTFEPGQTEAEVAGQIAHRLLRHHIEPVRVQVMADGQGRRYRHWSYGPDPIERHCILSAIGRRKGLHAGATRTVSMGAPSTELQETHGLATLVQATGMYFSSSEWKFAETWKRVERIYEKFGVPDEWRNAEQAEVIGYSVCEHC